jgi:hypothetical protein
LRTKLAALADLPEAQTRARVRALDTEHGPRREWVWARLGRARLATVLGHLVTLADATEGPVPGATRDALAQWYATEGYRADEAALRALSLADHADKEAIHCAVRALYVPWLQRVADALRAVVDAGGYPKPGAVAFADGTCLLFADGLRWDVGMMLVASLQRAGRAGRHHGPLGGLPPRDRNLQTRPLPHPPPALGRRGSGRLHPLDHRHGQDAGQRGVSEAGGAGRGAGAGGQRDGRPQRPRLDGVWRHRQVRPQARLQDRPPRRRPAPRPRATYPGAPRRRLAARAGDHRPRLAARPRRHAHGEHPRGHLREPLGSLRGAQGQHQGRPSHPPLVVGHHPGRHLCARDYGFPCEHGVRTRRAHPAGVLHPRAHALPHRVGPHGRHRRGEMGGATLQGHRDDFCPQCPPRPSHEGQRPHDQPARCAPRRRS